MVLENSLSLKVQKPSRLVDFSSPDSGDPHFPPTLDATLCYDIHYFSTLRHVHVCVFLEFLLRMKCTEQHIFSLTVVLYFVDSNDRFKSYIIFSNMKFNTELHRY